MVGPTETGTNYEPDRGHYRTLGEDTKRVRQTVNINPGLKRGNNLVSTRFNVVVKHEIRRILIKITGIPLAK